MSQRRWCCACPSQLTMGKQGLIPSTQQTKSSEPAPSVSFVPFLSLGNTGKLLQMSQAGDCVGVCDRPTTTTVLGRLLAELVTGSGCSRLVPRHSAKWQLETQGPHPLLMEGGPRSPLTWSEMGLQRQEIPGAVGSPLWVSLPGILCLTPEGQRNYLLPSLGFR